MLCLNQTSVVHLCALYFTVELSPVSIFHTSTHFDGGGEFCAIYSSHFLLCSVFKRSWRKKPKGASRGVLCTGTSPCFGGKAGNAHFEFHSHSHTSRIFRIISCMLVFPSHTQAQFQPPFCMILFACTELLAAVWCRCIAVPACQSVLLLGLSPTLGRCSVIQ